MPSTWTCPSAGARPCSGRRPAAGAGEDREQLGQDHDAEQRGAERPRPGPVARLVAAQVGEHDDEHEEHDDRAGVEHDLDRAEELGALQQEEPGHREEAEHERQALATTRRAATTTSALATATRAKSANTN